MKVLIVSEGEHELGDDSLDGALLTLSSRLLNFNENVSFEREKVSSPKVRQHAQPGRGGRYKKRALGWIRLAEREGYDAIILVIDQDGDEEREQQFDQAQDMKIADCRSREHLAWQSRRLMPGCLPMSKPYQRC